MYYSRIKKRLLTISDNQIYGIYSDEWLIWHGRKVNLVTHFIVALLNKSMVYIREQTCIAVYLKEKSKRHDFLRQSDIW